MIKFNSEQRFIVTGASSGIGEGVAMLLNELGATVIAVARNMERLEAMKAKCAYPENVFLEVKDLSEDIENLPLYVKLLKDKYGKFSGMAYCAGISDLQPLQILDCAEMKKMFDVNYFAPVFMAKGFADRRINAGRGSSAVFLSSIAAVCSDKGHTTYAGSKAALAASIKSIAREVAPAGVRMNCLLPAIIDTPMGKRGWDMGTFEGKYPFGIGSVEDVANFAVFLLSDDAKWITAQNYIVDCGSI